MTIIDLLRITTPEGIPYYEYPSDIPGPHRYSNNSYKIDMIILTSYVISVKTHWDRIISDGYFQYMCMNIKYF